MLQYSVIAAQTDKNTLSSPNWAVQCHVTSPAPTGSSPFGIPDLLKKVVLLSFLVPLGWQVVKASYAGLQGPQHHLFVF